MLHLFLRFGCKFPFYKLWNDSVEYNWRESEKEMLNILPSARRSNTAVPERNPQLWEVLALKTDKDEQWVKEKGNPTCINKVCE